MSVHDPELLPHALLFASSILRVPPSCKTILQGPSFFANPEFPVEAATRASFGDQIGVLRGSDVNLDRCQILPAGTTHARTAQYCRPSVRLELRAQRPFSGTHVPWQDQLSPTRAHTETPPSKADMNALSYRAGKKWTGNPRSTRASTPQPQYYDNSSVGPFNEGSGMDMAMDTERLAFANDHAWSGKLREREVSWLGSIVSVSIRHHLQNGDFAQLQPCVQRDFLFSLLGSDSTAQRQRGFDPTYSISSRCQPAPQRYR